MVGSATLENNLFQNTVFSPYNLRESYPMSGSMYTEVTNTDGGAAGILVYTVPAGRKLVITAFSSQVNDTNSYIKLVDSTSTAATSPVRASVSHVATDTLLALPTPTRLIFERGVVALVNSGAGKIFKCNITAELY